MGVPNSRKFVVEGTLPGNERFAFSWAAVGPTIVGASAQATAEAVVANTAFTAFITAAKPYWNSGTIARTLRCYYYANDGTLADTGAADISSGAGSSAAQVANQIAVVVSLRTAVSTRSGRGRMFLPGTGKVTDTTTGKMTGTNTALATAVANLMSYTLGQVASETQGVIRPVTLIRIGDVLDTVRARRSRIVEAYTQATVS